MVRFEDLEKGQDMRSRTVELSRASLVRYAGASGDFNPITGTSVSLSLWDCPA